MRCFLYEEMKYIPNKFTKFIFIFVFLVGGFLFAKTASAEIYYVDNTGGLDTNDGLSTTAPWKTVTKVNGVVFSAGDSILFKGGETWATQLKPSASGADENHITYGTYNKSGGLATLSASIDVNAKSDITFDGLHITGARIWADSGESSIYFNNCIIENTGSYGFDGNTAQTDIRFNNCVFARNLRYHIDAPAGAVTVRNSIFLSNANTDEGVWNAGTTGTLDIDYSLINTAQNFLTTKVTDGGHNLWYPDPKITSYPTSITPRFTFTFDDSGSIDSFYTLATTVLDTYGVKGTIFVSPALWTADQQTKAIALSANGHEIANHTLNHEDLIATQAFVVTSTNTNPTVDVDVATTTITLSCDEAGNVVTLDWSGNKTIQDLKTAVTGKGWTVTNSLQNSKTRQNTLLLDELADSGGAQVAPYTALLDIFAPNYKFWDHELNDAQDQIEALTGIRPTTMAYPYGYNNADLKTWMATNTTLTSARQVGGAPTTLASIAKWNFPQRSYCWSTADTEDTVRACARRMYFYAIGVPGFYLHYDHNTTQDYWTRYGWFIDELQSLGATFNTYGQLVSWIASDHADDGTTWTKTYTTTGADYHLLSTSPAINTGIDVGLTSDIIGTTIPQSTAPDIGAYEYLYYTLTYTAGAGGSITGSSPQTVASGGNGTAVTAVANTGYSFVNWSDSSTSNPRTDTSIAGNISVTANFAINTYTITASAGSHGSISPSSTTTVNSGDNQAFSITADSGYHIVDVLVDSVSVGAVSSYTFSSVTANHTISATFAVTSSGGASGASGSNSSWFYISVSSGPNGKITSSLGQTWSTSFPYGSDQTFNITPNEGYEIADVLIDGVSVGLQTTYAFKHINQPHSISTIFRKIETLNTVKGTTPEQKQIKIQELIVLINNLKQQIAQIQNMPSAVFTTPLWIGLQSEDVRRLQTLLATKPEIYPEGKITGYFGSLTKKAVQRFQLQYSVVDSELDPALGYVGPKTRIKLKEVFGN